MTKNKNLRPPASEFAAMVFKWLIEIGDDMDIRQMSDIAGAFRQSIHFAAGPKKKRKK